jgi:hypothetical protein
MKVYAKQLGIVLLAFGMQVTTKFMCPNSLVVREEFARISLGVRDDFAGSTDRHISVRVRVSNHCPYISKIHETAPVTLARPLSRASGERRAASARARARALSITNLRNI